MKFTSVLAIAALAGVPACGPTEVSDEVEADRFDRENADIAPQLFMVELNRSRFDGHAR